MSVTATILLSALTILQPAQQQAKPGHGPSWPPAYSAAQQANDTAMRQDARTWGGRVPTDLRHLQAATVNRVAFASVSTMVVRQVLSSDKISGVLIAYHTLDNKRYAIRDIDASGLSDGSDMSSLGYQYWRVAGTAQLTDVRGAVLTLPVLEPLSDADLRRILRPQPAKKGR